MTTKTTIKFGKFEGATDYAEDDREAFIYANGEVVGTITAVIDNFGGVLTPEWRVRCYTVELWDESGVLTQSAQDFPVRRKLRGSGVSGYSFHMVQKATEAKRAAKDWALPRVRKLLAAAAEKPASAPVDSTKMQQVELF